MKTRQIFLFFIFVLLWNVSNSQEIKITDPPIFNMFKEYGLISGYNFSLTDSASKFANTIDVGIWRSEYVEHIVPICANTYASITMGLSGDTFIAGPKIGGYLGMGMLCIGSEMTAYTDFTDYNFFFTPYFGLGVSNYRITIGANIQATNEKFMPVNKLMLSLTMQLVSLKTTKVEDLLSPTN
jgi:hypothetical protein